MKTTIEINGFEIVISETEGAIVVSAIKEDETIEEFTLDIEEGAQGQAQSQDLQDFAQEEPDFAQEMQDGAQDFAQGQAQGQGMSQDEDEIKLESFETFFNKRK